MPARKFLNFGKTVKTRRNFRRRIPKKPVFIPFCDCQLRYIFIASALAILYNDSDIGFIKPLNYNRFSEDGRQKESISMAKFVCTVCGYIYDEEVGDPDNGIEPGTLFADLPDDWECPLCSVGKEDFEEEA